jgi:hypothetical protein
VDGLVVYSTRQVLVVLDVLQAIRLVPARWEDVEGDLAADRVAITPLVECKLLVFDVLTSSSSPETLSSTLQ